MKYVFLILGVVFLLTVFASGTNKPVEATVCQVLANPVGFDGKTVRVRGRVTLGMEDFSLSDTGCNGAIWLEFGYPEQSPTPYCCPGGWDEHGKPIFSRPLVQLRRDDNFKRLKNALSATIPGAKDEDGNDCRRYRPPAGECLRYGVTATLTGRISGVNRKPNELNGFGHMGMFSAKLLIQSVERVEATETHPGKN